MKISSFNCMGLVLRIWTDKIHALTDQIWANRILLVNEIHALIV